jgi:hypothetical protein
LRIAIGQGANVIEGLSCQELRGARLIDDERTLNDVVEGKRKHHGILELSLLEGQVTVTVRESREGVNDAKRSECVNMSYSTMS